MVPGPADEGRLKLGGKIPLIALGPSLPAQPSSWIGISSLLVKFSKGNTMPEDCRLKEEATVVVMG